MYALITGASSGVGKAYAEILARDYKLNLLLISNQETELKQIASELCSRYAVKALPYYCDLSRREAAQEIYDWCTENNINIDILINNAGVFFWHPLNEVEPERVSTMLNLHILTPTLLCRFFMPSMMQRHHGFVLNMSSMTSWMAFPGIQCYNASKAYMLNFSKSMWYEAKAQGVVVTTLTPGAIDTPLYGLDNKTRRRLVRAGISFTPEKFAKIALRRMFNGRKTAMPGLVNHIAVPLLKHLPDWAVFVAMRHLPQYKKLMT